MRRSRAITRCIIIMILVMMVCSVSIGIVAADGPGGPHAITGKVYNADGRSPTDGYEGAYAAVIVEHNGNKKTYEDPNGLEQDEDGVYWFAVTVPEGAWDIGDKYWVWVDGSGWGDEDFTCVDHSDSGVNSWEMTLESEQVDVNTGDYNFEPLIAIIFAIILIVVGIIIGLLRPLRIPFSGRPRKSDELMEEGMITGVAVIPEPLPEEAPEGAAAVAAEGEAEAGEAAAAGAPEGEAPICDSCGKPMEYIPEYSSYYCYDCKKYPPEEEPPPPEDEGGAPEEAKPDADSPPEGGA